LPALLDHEAIASALMILTHRGPSPALADARLCSAVCGRSMDRTHMLRYGHGRGETFLSAGDETKTKEELLAEIEALRAELERRGSDDGKRTPAAPIGSVSMTRRESIASWVAPVILSLPVFAAGMVLMPGKAHAAVTRAPTTKKAAPTAKPTVAATAAPTAAPTAAASAAPTVVGRCIPAPTVSPTLGMAAAPDAGVGAVRFVALGSARRAAGVQLGL
jgi:hypothetical protein